MDLVEILKAIADENRIRILNLLKEGELCVCNIEAVLGLSQSNTSRHMNKLKSAGIIESRKSAQWVHYSLKKITLEKYPFLKNLFNNFENEDILKEDLDKFKNLNICNTNKG